MIVVRMMIRFLQTGKKTNKNSHLLPAKYLPKHLCQRKVLLRRGKTTTTVTRTTLKMMRIAMNRPTIQIVGLVMSNRPLKPKFKKRSIKQMIAKAMMSLSWILREASNQLLVRRQKLQRKEDRTTHIPARAMMTAMTTKVDLLGQNLHLHQGIITISKKLPPQ